MNSRTFVRSEFPCESLSILIQKYCRRGEMRKSVPCDAFDVDTDERDLYGGRQAMDGVWVGLLDRPSPHHDAPKFTTTLPEVR
jgi:hypothetical protein